MCEGRGRVGALAQKNILQKKTYKYKDKLFPVYAMKAYKEYEGRAP